MGDFLNIQPSELKFPFELRKQSTCSMLLTNRTDQYVAFKVKTTNPKKYCVRPNAGVVLPNSVCNITVTMQAQKEAPSDMQCRDKFLIQSLIAPNGATNKDVTPELFNRDEGKVINEFKLRVIYIPANPPSPVPEGDEEATSPGTSSNEDEIRKPNLPEAVPRSFAQPFESSSSAEGWSAVSKLTEEKDSALRENRKLLHELELMKKRTRQGQGGVVSIYILLLGLILGILVGYFIGK